MRLPILLAAACAAALAAPAPAAATDPSGGATAPVDASAEPYTGGSAAPAEAPSAPVVRAPSTLAPSAPAVTPTPAHVAATSTEPEPGGKPPSQGSDSPPLEPLPPAAQRSQAKAKSGGSSLALTGGAVAITFTLGFGFLAAGLAGTALARRRVLSENA